MSTNTHTLQGTHHVPKANTKILGKLEDEHPISTTWILNRNLNNDELNGLVNEITNHCNQHGLNVTRDDTYHVKASGNSINFTNALNVQMNKYQDNTHAYHATSAPINIPHTWADKVHNILGLNTKKIAHPYFKKNAASGNSLVPFNPLQLASLYNFPTNLNGTGQKIGIIELGGGYVLSDITTYFSQLGISATPNITAVSVDGGTNDPSDPSGASVEVILDIEVIAAIVPDSTIRVYFAPNTDQGFYDAIRNAATDGCGLISISWGAAEAEWDPSTLTSYNTLLQTVANLGVNVAVAAGDNGSSDGISGNNVDFPGSSPFSLSCGGTRLQANGDTISSETVWNDGTNSASGGGISKVFSEPGYQDGVTFALGGKRGVPDVTGDADPDTGYILYSAAQGGQFVVGGTSAVAPLWTGLLARISQSIGHYTGFFNPIIYAHPNACHDITQGNNGAYSAGPGWDACSGNGSPNGQLILNLFSALPAPVAAFNGTPTSGTAPLQVQFTDQSTNSPNQWAWTFGDNTTSTQQSPSHTYSQAGTYTVSLTATNNSGHNTLTKTNYITVTAPQNAPVAAFTGSPTSGNTPLVVHFTDQSTNSPNQWLWTFGDNTTSTQQSPSHTYSQAGTYTVSLTATNNIGHNTLTKTNYIHVTTSGIPQAAFVGSPVSGKRPLTVHFTDESTNSPNRWFWSFGDGNISLQKNPVHTYQRVGHYSVRLIAGNNHGSTSDTKTNYINVTE
jgi:kumamolisin